jgi:hypothetical protein
MPNLNVTTFKNTVQQGEMQPCQNPFIPKKKMFIITVCQYFSIVPSIMCHYAVQVLQYDNKNWREPNGNWH